MLRIEKTKQTKFVFGPAAYEKLIDKDNILYKLNQYVDFSFVNEECKDLYCEDNGRPANEPEKMFRAETVQFFRNYSDRDMETAARYDILVKWFLGIDIDDTGFDYSTVSKFRARLGSERHEKIFNGLLGQIKCKGFIPDGGVSFTDATHMIANIAIPNTMKLIRQANAKLLRAIKKSDNGIHEKVTENFEKIDDLEDTSSKKNNDYGQSAQQKKRNFEGLVKDTYKLIHVTEALFAQKQDDHPEVKESLDLLKRILDENTEKTDGEEGEIIVEKKEKPKDRTPSAVDPDARHGAKSKTKKFTGYKIHSVVNSNGIITGIDATEGNVPDEDATDDLLKKQKEGIGTTPDKLGSDKKYGDGKTRKKIRKNHGVEIVAPLKGKINRTGLFTNDQFRYDEEKNELTCPEGKTTNKYSVNEGNKMFRFGRLCKNCPQRDKCTTSRTGRTVNINKYYGEYERAKEFNQTEEYKNIMSDRMMIERKQGEMKEHHSLKRALYWGLEKIKIQAILTAAVVNLKQFVKLLEDKSSETSNREGMLRVGVSVSSVS